MSDVLEFAWAVVNNWAGYATGGLVVATFWLFFVWKDKQMPRTLGFTLAGIFLLMAFFKAWKEQRQNVRSRDADIEILQGQIGDLKKSNIVGEVVFAVLGKQAEGSHAGLIVNLTNDGAPSAIDPSSWKFTARTSDGKIYRGSPNTLIDKNLDFCMGPSRAMRFVRTDALYLKASEPIEHNGFLQGFLWFSIPALNDLSLKDPATILLIQSKSIAGQEVSVSTTVKDLRDKTGKTTFFPGIENPRALDVPCEENTPY
jgi:hypothetical protein